MTHEVDRRGALECMLWAGTGMLWVLNGGIPRSIGIAAAAELPTGAFTFLQISDSHIGFDKPANPNALGTLQEAIAKIKAAPVKPAFMLHTGDITHLSKDKEFDDADQAIKASGLTTFYVPGEHDVIDEGTGKAYLAALSARMPKAPAGTASTSTASTSSAWSTWSILKPAALATLAASSSNGWRTMLRACRQRRRSSSSRTFRSGPSIPQWGWGTEDGARALGYLKRFGSVTVLNGHIHQIMQKVEGNVSFHTARSTAFPQPEPGKAESPGPMAVPAGDLGKYLGITNVNFTKVNTPLAIMDFDAGRHLDKNSSV